MTRCDKPEILLSTTHKEIRVMSEKNGGPTVSVIILSHNYGHDLMRAARSVFEQKYAPIEVVILDVGSDDNTWEIAQQIAREHPSFPVRLKQLPNVGPSIARNHGAAMTRGEFLLFLDADDYLSPEFLNKTMLSLMANPRASLAYAACQMFGGQVGQWATAPYDFKRLCRENLFNYCVLLRREAFLQVGGFDEENFGYYEDWELWIRLGKRGWDVAQVPETLFFYQSHLNTSLMAYLKRLDRSCRAYIANRHPELYTAEEVEAARKTLRDAPPGWHKRPPMKGVKNMERLSTQFPDNRHVLYFLGVAQMEECRPEEAVVTFTRLLQIDPKDEDAKVALQKAKMLAPYCDGLPGTALTQMKRVKNRLNCRDLATARDELAVCFATLLDIPTDDARAKKAANVAMNHTLDVADDWQRLAEDRERLIHELRGWIAQLTTGKEWLEKQWKYWEHKAKEDKVRWWRTPSKSVTRFLRSERPASKTTN